MDVDKNGLTLPFILVIWVMAFGFSRVTGVWIDLSSRSKSLLPVLLIIGGGFALDWTYGETLITEYMVGHGYSRCEAGDWEHGNGKSRVWFADYVLAASDCREHIK